MRRFLVVVALATGACAPPDSVPTTSPVPVVSSSTPVGPITEPTTATTTSTTTSTTTTLRPLRGLRLEVVAEGLGQLTFVTSRPGDGKLLAVQRDGKVLVIDNDGDRQEEFFLDISDRVSSGGIEQGLLAMAFHPRFADNGRVFVYYVDREANSRLVEFTAADGRVDPGSEKLLIAFDQFVERHYGGMLQFGPDGYLWSSHGEGGKASLHAQNTDSLLGSILRIDVDGGDPYAIPADNPFASGGGAGEVWAKGLRNPWRFAIDSESRLVYIADVGHSEWEEVNVVSIDQGGYNFGWLPMEGTRCFERRKCDPEGKVLPVLEYPHSEGCSVTGGYVYRGAAIPELTGHYFYSDWCTGWLRSLVFDGSKVVETFEWTDDVGPFGQANSFGVDPNGELLIATHEGRLLRIVPER